VLCSRLRIPAQKAPLVIAMPVPYVVKASEYCSVHLRFDALMLS